MKKLRKVNRKASRKLLFAGRMRAGCFLMAAALVCLSPGAGQVRAETTVSKEVVSQNKAKKENEKDKKGTDAGKLGQQASAGTVQPSASQAASATSAPQITSAGLPATQVPQVTTAPAATSAPQPQATSGPDATSVLQAVPGSPVMPAPQVSVSPQATGLPQVTSGLPVPGMSQVSPVPRPTAIPQVTDGADNDGKSSDDEKTDSVSQMEDTTDSANREGTEKDPAQGSDGGKVTPVAQATGSPVGDSGDSGQISDGSVSENMGRSDNVSGIREDGMGVSSGTDGETVQPSDSGYHDSQGESSHIEDGIADDITAGDDTTAPPVVGIVEGASTIIVGGLVPSVQEDVYAQEQVNENVEDGGNEEARSLIAGSTPLVGAAIADDGYSTGNKSQSKKEATVTPKATVTPSSGSSGGSGSAAAPTATAAAPAQNNTVAMDTSGQRSIVPTSAPSAGNSVGDGLRVAGVRTGDSTNILPFVLAGAAALAAIVVLVVLKVKRGRKEREQE